MTRKYTKPLAKNLGEFTAVQGACLSGSGVNTAGDCATGGNASGGSAGSCSTGTGASGNPGGQSCKTGIGVVG